MLPCMLFCFFQISDFHRGFLSLEPTNTLARSLTVSYHPGVLETFCFSVKMRSIASVRVLLVQRLRLDVTFCLMRIENLRRLSGWVGLYAAIQFLSVAVFFLWNWSVHLTSVAKIAAQMSGATVRRGNVRSSEFVFHWKEKTNLVLKQPSNNTISSFSIHFWKVSSNPPKSSWFQLFDRSL